MFSGLTSMNADPPYAVPHMRATIRWLTDAPLRPSNLRAPGKIGNVFAVERPAGNIRVTRVVCAHDCGMMVNPDAVRAQVEGSVLQTLSRTLFEQVTFDRSAVTSTDWTTYPIPPFPDVPRLEIALLDRSLEPPLGAGESAAAPVAAALGNAVFDAAGVRLREVPFTPARLKAALAAEAS
jgi:nicotinate dehydrogenase subunit B